MGRTADSYGNDGNQSALFTLLPAGEDIARGELAILGNSDSLVYAANAGNSGLQSFLRPLEGGPAVENYIINSLSVTGGSYTGVAGAETMDVIKLTNGNIVTTWLEGPTVSFRITTQDAENIAYGSLPAYRANGFVSAVALANGGFALASASEGGAAYLTVLNEKGAIVVDSFVAVSGGGYTHARVAQLVNGNIIVIGRAATSVFYALWNPAGAQVRATSTCYSSGQSVLGERTTGVAALAGGGFVIAYVVCVSSVFTAYAQRYDAAGVAQGSAVLICPLNGSGGTPFVFIVPLTDGGYATAFHATSVGLILGIFNAVGALQQGALVNLGQMKVTHQGCQLGFAAAPNGDVGVCWISQDSGLIASRFSAQGVALARVTLLPDLPLASASLQFNADNTATATTSLSTGIKVLQLTAAMNLVSRWDWAADLKGIPNLRAMLATSAKTNLPCYLYVLQGSNGAISMGINIIRRQAFTLVGVTASAAKKNSPVLVQFSGQATLRTPFGSLWAVNRNNASPPGQRMYAIGNTAVLSGFQPTFSNPIN